MEKIKALRSSVKVFYEGELKGEDKSCVLFNE